MTSKPLQISKPHYCSRYDQSPKNHQKHSCQHSPQSSAREAHTPPLVISLSLQEKNTIKQLKEDLLKLLKENKETWQSYLLQRQAAIKKFREQHLKIMEKVLAEIEEIRRNIYEQYRHSCSSKKRGDCSHCKKRQKEMKQVIDQYFDSIVEDGSRNMIKRKYLKKYHDLQDQKKKKSQRNKGDGQHYKVSQKSQFDPINQINVGFQISVKGQPLASTINQEKQNISPFDGSNSNNDAIDFSYENQENSLFVFKSRSKERMFSSLNKRPVSRRIPNLNESESSEKIIKERDKNMRGSKSKNTYLRNNNTKMFKTQTQQNEDLQIQQQQQNNPNSEEPQGFKKNTCYSNTRKSSIKHPTAFEINQIGNSYKSKFHPLNQTSVQPEDSVVNPSRQQESSKTGKFTEGKTSKLNSPLPGKAGLKKQKKKEEIKKKVKGLNDQEILIDLDEVESAKHIEQMSQLESEEEQQRLGGLKKNKNYKKDEKNNKMSRYRREKLFYTMLKREINDCLSSSAELLAHESEKEEEKEKEPIQSLLNTTTHYLKGTESQSSQSKYSILERKRSLITKLNMINQTSNFEDIKAKIETILESKDQYLIEKAGKELMVMETINPTQGTKRQIVEKFLADVLKINDLKRLLKNKFCKERHWGQKMRQMHQFYTYLQYSLQNFRSTLEKNVESNWQEIGWEGLEAQFDVEDLIITQNMGHYQGLENIELNEYEHHKEIECSMKYYGIEVKKIEQLNNYTQFFQPSKYLDILSNNLAQKSLKQIKQIEEEEEQVEADPGPSKKVTFQ